MAFSVRIDAVRSRSDARAFVELPCRLHRQDPFWVPPLRRAERDRWTPRRNPVLGRLRAERFLALREGRAVGRIAAFVDLSFSERWEPATGFFGFFECDERPDTARALLAIAEERLRSWGCRAVVGPVDLTTHDEVGFVVEGFDRRPAVLQPYNPPRYPRAVEQAGYRGYRDYGAWDWTPDSLPSASVARLERMAAGPAGLAMDVRIRPMNHRRFDDELTRLHVLYNRTFVDVWGVVPISWPEFRARGHAFRAFYRPELVLVAEVADEPVGFGLVLPDVNEVLSRLDGRLLPWGWLRLVLGVRRISTGRFILLGVEPGHRGRGIAPLLALRMRQAVLDAGIERVDVSLIQLANRRMVRVVEAFGCQPTRVFRLYRKEL